MTTSNIVTLNQVVTINDVDSVAITEIVDDGTGTSTWIRSIRLFGEPLGLTGPAVMEIRIRSTTKTNLDIVTPTLTF